MPAALAGERREIDSPHAGRVSWYQDGPVDRRADAIPLLLIHSVNAAASAYEVKPLYDGYRAVRPVYALDLPGYGFSDRSNRRYDPRLMTDAIRALVAEIRRERPDAMIDALALSLSSEFLVRAAVELPEVFRSVGLVSPTGFNRNRLRDAPAGSTLGRPGVLAFLMRPRIRRRIFRLLTRRGVIRYFLGRTYGSRRIDEGLLDYDYATTRPLGAEYAPLHFLSGFLFSGDSGTLYRALCQPVWAVHGVRGDFVDYRSLPELSGRPNWTVEVFQTGALPHFEEPEAFVRRYEAWCALLGLET